jgi:hypothetical protein
MNGPQDHHAILHATTSAYQQSFVFNLGAAKRAAFEDRQRLGFGNGADQGNPTVDSSRPNRKIRSDWRLRRPA